MNHDDLALLTLDQLLDEVDKRVDHYIFHGRRKIGEGSDEDQPVYAYRRSWKGQVEDLVLLTRLMEQKIVNDHLLREEDPEPWEEL